MGKRHADIPPEGVPCDPATMGRSVRIPAHSTISGSAHRSQSDFRVLVPSLGVGGKAEAG